MSRHGTDSQANLRSLQPVDSHQSDATFKATDDIENSEASEKPVVIQNQRFFTAKKMCALVVGGGFALACGAVYAFGEVEEITGPLNSGLRGLSVGDGSNKDDLSRRLHLDIGSLYVKMIRADHKRLDDQIEDIYRTYSPHLAPAHEYEDFANRENRTGELNAVKIRIDKQLQDALSGKVGWELWNYRVSQSSGPDTLRFQLSQVGPDAKSDLLLSKIRSDHKRLDDQINDIRSAYSRLQASVRENEGFTVQGARTRDLNAVKTRIDNHLQDVLSGKAEWEFWNYEVSRLKKYMDYEVSHYELTPINPVKKFMRK